MGAGTGLSGCIERCWVRLLVGVLKGIGGCVRKGLDKFDSGAGKGICGCVRNGLAGGWIGLLVGAENGRMY